MKTAGRSTRRVAGQVHRSECAVRNCWKRGHEKVPTRGKPGLERPGRPRGERNSDTIASAVLADPSGALQGTNWGSGPAMEESENDLGSLEQLLLYADEHYLAGKLPLGDHLGKGVHGKGAWISRFASARCLEIVCGNNFTPTSARIVERVTVGLTKVLAARSFDPSLLVVFLVVPDPGFCAWVPFTCPLLPTISNDTLRAIHLASNTACRPACSFHPDDQASLKLA
ncbi:15-hydroxyprostaglandin dehydrogenase [Trichonephila clavipes]|nr:15-hydroxyprostaglandin dehydrogenase [Trichonephila clavipes]